MVIHLLSKQAQLCKKTFRWSKPDTVKPPKGDGRMSVAETRLIDDLSLLYYNGLSMKGAGSKRGVYR